MINTDNSISHRGNLFGIVAVALLVYIVSLWGTYAYDDIGAIVTEPRVQDIRLVRGIWTKPYWELSADHLFRPLVMQSFAVEWWLHGDKPWIMHLVNIVLHAGCCALVYALIQRISGPKVGLIAGLLFAVHPVHVEAVANLVGRAEILCCIGVLAAALFTSAELLTPWRIAGTALCMLFAILSKEQGYLTPFLLILLLGTQLKWHRPDSATKNRIQWLLVVVSFVYLGNMIVREFVLNIKLTFEHSQLEWQVNPIAHAHGYHRALLPVTVLGRYVFLLICPLHLSLDYGGYVIGDHFRIADPFFWLGVASLCAYFGLVLRYYFRRDLQKLFYLLSLGMFYWPISHFGSTIGTIMGERLMYLPSVFFVGLVGCYLNELSSKARQMILWPVVVLMVLRSVSYAWVWNDEARLYKYAWQTQPRSTQAMALHSTMLSKQGHLEEALRVAEQGVVDMPESPGAWINAAIRSMDLKRLDQAEHYLKELRKLEKPNPYSAGLWGRLTDLRKASATFPGPSSEPSTKPSTSESR